MRTKLAQLKANKSPLLQSYLHTVDPETYKPQWPLCLSHTHDTNHLFNCNQLPTQHNTTTSLWKKPLKAAEVIQEWESRLASLFYYLFFLFYLYIYPPDSQESDGGANT